MLYCHLVAVNHLALEISVDLVEIESVRARDEALCLEDVSTEFIECACGARIVAGGLDTSGEVACLYLETLYIVSLPAVHAQVEVLKLLKYFFCIDAKLCIAFFGDFIRLMDKLFFHII